LTLTGPSSGCPLNVSYTAVPCVIALTRSVSAGGLVCAANISNVTTPVIVAFEVMYDGSIFYTFDGTCENKLGGSSGSSKTLLIILAVVGAVVLLIVIAVVVIMVLKGKKKEGGDEETGNVHQPLNN